MANISVRLTDKNKLKISFAGRQAQHIRLTEKWTDWMLAMDDFRDLISALDKEDVNDIIKELLNKSNSIAFSEIKGRQEYNLSADKKIVRRLGPGNTRKEYQSVALFIKNEDEDWPPPVVQISIKDLLKLIRAMITLDKPITYCVIDSLRNFQYLLAILWIKKVNPRLLEGLKKPKANEIFRIALVK